MGCLPVDNVWLGWLLGLPIGGAAIASVFLYFGWRGSTLLYRVRLEVLALAFVATGLLLSMLVTLAAEGRVLFEDVGFEFSPPTKMVLFVVNVSLLCSLFANWSSPTRSDRSWGVWATALTSSLLAGALVAQDGIVSVLCLFGAALVIISSASAIPLSVLREAVKGPQVDEARILSAKRVTGGLKHLAIAVVGTGLLVVGVLLLSRYGLTLENKGLLQLGVGLLSIGLLVRAGAMPFAGASADLIDASPGPAINLLGAATPAVILVGLMLLLPVDRSVLTGNSTAWIGAVAVLLAGVRALGVRLPDRPTAEADTDTSTVPAELVAATIALQVGWAITGALAGSDAGALLLSLNIALAVPLTIVSAARVRSSPVFCVGLFIGVVSLLGLPPFGGFAGTLLVAQASVNLSGFWLAVMLLGSMLVAAKWLSHFRFWWPIGHPDFGLKLPVDQNLKLDAVLVVALAISQLILLLLSLVISY